MQIGAIVLARDGVSGRNLVRSGLERLLVQIPGPRTANDQVWAAIVEPMYWQQDISKSRRAGVVVLRLFSYNSTKKVVVIFEDLRNERIADQAATTEEGRLTLDIPNVLMEDMQMSKARQDYDFCSVEKLSKIVSRSVHRNDDLDSSEMEMVLEAQRNDAAFSRVIRGRFKQFDRTNRVDLLV